MHKREYNFFVYLLASRSHQLYVGMTNSLEVRMPQHRAAPAGSYTARYKINRLVYFEHTSYVLNAIAREDQLKEWSHEEKVALIESVNPAWMDLSEDWGEGVRRFWRKVPGGVVENAKDKQERARQAGRQLRAKPQIPFGNDKDKEATAEAREQPQIPSGNDKDKEATAEARTTADSLRE